MKLQDLLLFQNYRRLFGKTDREISSLQYNSKDVVEDSVFFAISGHSCNGKDFIQDAICNGAKTIVLENYRGDEITPGQDITIVEVEDARKALAHMSNRFYNNPSEEMQVIGVTGTKGKTSVTYMIKHILENAGIKCGIIGTVMTGYDGHYHEAHRTTPESLEIQKLMREMADAGCKAVVMEVSSQGLMDSRVEKIDFDIGVFTNIFPDHIGPKEHKDFEEYISCKSHLFDLAPKAVANYNDPRWKEVIKPDGWKKVILYGDGESCDFKFEDLFLGDRNENFGTGFRVAFGKNLKSEEQELFINLPGRFNVYNAMAAISVARELGIPWEAIKESLRTIKIPGRTEIVPCGRDYTTMVDYAHNGVALKNLLTSLKECRPNRLMVVFGAGGNRARNRRFEMGKAAFELADYIIITSDNPRHESPEDIIKDITSVMDFCHKPILVIPDRRKAIERAMDEGTTGDIIVVAGKGHETYQIIGDEILFFDDKEVILSHGKEQ